MTHPTEVRPLRDPAATPPPLQPEAAWPSAATTNARRLKAERATRSARWRQLRAAAVLAVALAALLGVAAAARGSVAPTHGGPRTTFTATFAPEREFGVTLSLRGPRASRCRRLETFVVPGAAATRGQFSFGPRTPGARPQRRGDRRPLRAWCRGQYRGVIEAGEEFELPTRVLGRVRFRVR